MYQPMIVSYKNREAEVDIVCGVGNSVLQIVFENSVQMNKVLSLHHGIRGRRFPDGGLLRYKK